MQDQSTHHVGTWERTQPAKPPPAQRLRGSAPHSRTQISHDAWMKWWIIGMMVLAIGFICITAGWHIPIHELAKPLAFTAVLLGFGWYYRFRRIERFALCTRCLLHVVLFSSCYTVLMYVAASGQRLLIDGYLVSADEYLGFHLPAVVSWVRAHPHMKFLLDLSYDTLLPQTALTIAVLGLMGARSALDSFVLRFMVAALLTLVVFAWLPAEGPFRSYGLQPGEAQQRYLEHLAALRSGQLRAVSWSNAEGLITFPSFHTTWAILMALAFRRYRVLAVLAFVLNAAVIVSTMTTAWHYLSDVLGGVAVAAIAVVFTHVARRWLDPQAPSPSRRHAVPAAAPLPGARPF